MKFKSVLMLAVAMACGLVAMMGVQQAISGGKEPAQSVDMVDVLVAISEISPGAPLNETNVQFKPWAKELVPVGAVTKAEEYKERAVRARVLPGEVIMKARLGEPGEYGASTEIPDGMRVVTVQVNLTMTHSGLLLPGDRVDVLVTYKARGQDRMPITKTKTVLEYIKVFATDSLRDSQHSETQEVKSKNISLLVTPQQAGLLKLAEDKGNLHLVLRSQHDDTNYPDIAVDESFFEDGVVENGKKDNSDGQSAGDVRSFLNNEPKQAEPKPIEVAETEPTRPMWKIEIYAGDERRIEEVELLENGELPNPSAVKVEVTQASKQKTVEDSSTLRNQLGTSLLSNDLGPLPQQPADPVSPATPAGGDVDPGLKAKLKDLLGM